jgi:hypothetical protein
MTCEICGVSEYYISEYQDQITDEYVKLDPPEMIVTDSVTSAIDEYTKKYPNRWTWDGACLEEIKNDPCTNGSCGFDCHKEESMNVKEKIKAKLCDLCEGEGNFCIEKDGKSVCGLCQIEGF